MTDEGVEVVQLDLETSLGELRAGGKLGDPPDYSSSQFEFQLNGESLQRIAAAYGVDGMPDYPIEVVAWPNTSKTAYARSDR